MKAVVARRGHGMVLADDKLLANVPTIQEFLKADDPDPIVHLVWFDIYGRQWHVLAFDRGDVPIAWCHVTSPDCPEGEQGSVDVRELAEFATHRGALGVERDLHWSPTRLSEVG